MVNSFLRPIQHGKCVDILREGRRALSAHQDSMSESDSKEKGNLKEERPKSSKASSKLHTKVEKEKETDQGKTKQKPSGLYPVLDEFADLTLSDSAEDELDSEEEEDLEEAAAVYERERPLMGALDIYTDGSKTGIGAYVVQGQEPVCLRFQVDAPQIVECQIVCEVFRRFREPFNLISDSHYIVNAVHGLEISALIKDSNPVHIVLQHLCALIWARTNPFYIGHIKAHTLLPGPMTAANDWADKATRAFAAFMPETKSLASQFHHLYHVPAHILSLKFNIPQQMARDIVKACPSCVQFLHPPHIGINPMGLRPGYLWQMDVTHISSFGRLSYVHVSMDTCSGVIFASPLTVEVDPKTFPIMTLLRERRDFGITAVIVAAIAVSAASAITVAVAMANQTITNNNLQLSPLNNGNHSSQFDYFLASIPPG
ncbi:hypothetical protein STEG23_030513 [Scotinomys teguina]